MPHDLFGDAVVRPRVRPARRVLSVASIVAHAIAIAFIVVAQLLATGPLPAVHRPLAFEYMPVQAIELPPPRAAARPAALPSATVSPNAAPLEAPRTITIETGHENATASSLGIVSGVEHGATSVEGLVRGDATTPPPPPPPPQQPVRLHAGIEPPRKIVDVTPTYPTIARSARVQGVVILEAIIDVNGNVDAVKVLRSIPLLDDAAVDAVRRWRYRPATLNGQPVPVIVTVTVNFALDR